MSGVNNLRIALKLCVLLSCFAAGAAQSNHMGLVEEADDEAINGTDSAISIKVSSTPNNAADVESITFTYDVYNCGTSELCNITINNSLSGMAPFDPFDLEPGENETLTAKYNIASEDRDHPFLVNKVRATGYSCETGQATTSAIAVKSIKITSFGE